MVVVPQSKKILVDIGIRILCLWDIQLIGPSSRSFLKELGRRVTAETGEARETSYLLQRLSVAIQRGNAAAVLGCAAHPD